MRKFFIIILLSSFFTVVIFLLNYNFFLDEEIENNIAEEKYIDVEINNKIKTENKKIQNIENILQDIEKKQISNFYKNKKQEKYNFSYSPKSYKNEIKLFSKNLNIILEKNLFKSKVKKLNISLLKKKIDRRWRMENKSVKLFWINNVNYNEYLSVFIHEFAHYLDIYFLEKKVFFDISNKFYEISWENTKIKKINQNTNDFVSWYSMTNKYEDFAETFTYYVLHNKDFLQKTKKSKILKLKYDFFANYIFKNKEFFATKFTKNIKIKDYYRDITKIKFDEKKLFNYLEKIN